MQVSGPRDPAFIWQSRPSPDILPSALCSPLSTLSTTATKTTTTTVAAAIRTASQSPELLLAIPHSSSPAPYRSSMGHNTSTVALSLTRCPELAHTPAVAASGLSPTESSFASLVWRQDAVRGPP
ncbi:hypothetical protein MBLNU459_g7577t1 [Dothideomycetes sp. NU459]